MLSINPQPKNQPIQSFRHVIGQRKEGANQIFPNRQDLNPFNPLRPPQIRCHWPPRAVIDVVSDQAVKQTSNKASGYWFVTIQMQWYQSLLVFTLECPEIGPSTSPKTPQSRSEPIFDKLLKNSPFNLPNKHKLPHQYETTYQHKCSEWRNPGLEAYLARITPQTCTAGHPALFWTCSTLIFDTANTFPSNHCTNLHPWAKPNDW